MKKKFDEFICRLFKHRWKYVRLFSRTLKYSFILQWEYWRFCKRCGIAEWLQPPPPEHPNCRCSIARYVGGDPKMEVCDIKLTSDN